MSCLLEAIKGNVTKALVEAHQEVLSRRDHELRKKSVGGCYVGTRMVWGIVSAYIITRGQSRVARDDTAEGCKVSHIR